MARGAPAPSLNELMLAREFGCSCWPGPGHVLSSWHQEWDLTEAIESGCRGAAISQSPAAYWRNSTCVSLLRLGYAVVTSNTEVSVVTVDSYHQILAHSLKVCGGLGDSESCSSSSSPGWLRWDQALVRALAGVRQLALHFSVLTIVLLSSSIRYKRNSRPTLVSAWGKST